LPWIGGPSSSSSPGRMRNFTTENRTMTITITKTVIVGIQPEVAFAMVQLGMSFEDVQTALDLEEGLALLEAGFGGS
jgi:hypothetical protein